MEVAAVSAEVAGVAEGEETAAGAQACPETLVLEAGHCEVCWEKMAT